MEIFYQICLTLLVALIGAILWATMSVFHRPLLRLSFRALSVLLTAFVIVDYVWTDFTLGEIALFVLHNVIGWGIFLLLIYLAITFSLTWDRYTKALKDIETLKKRADRHRDDIEKLAQSARKLGAPISREKVKVY